MITFSAFFSAALVKLYDPVMMNSRSMIITLLCDFGCFLSVKTLTPCLNKNIAIESFEVLLVWSIMISIFKSLLWAFTISFSIFGDVIS